MGMAETLYAALGGNPAIRIEAFDGSSAGPPDAASGLSLRSPLAVRHLISGRGSLGPARAFVPGELELTGDPYTALKELTSGGPELAGGSRLDLLRAAVRAGGIGVLRPAAP